VRYALLTLAFLALAACDTLDPQSGTVPLDATAALPVYGQATSRPIEEFLAANQAPFFIWQERSDRPSDGRVVWVDYSGFLKAWVFANSGGTVELPRTFEGTITERPVRGGGAEVHVRLRIRDALVFARDPGNIPIFGYSLSEVAWGGAEPALADVQFHLNYFDPEGPGAPIRNIGSVERRRTQLIAHRDGPLRAGFAGAEEGEPGRLNVVQNGVSVPGRGNGVADGFPVEFIDVRATGGK
jgi:hypothetical protein